MPQTVQCPQCKSAVTVRDEAAGRRVQCPTCQKEFLAPGLTASSNDDDDWLLLDHEQAPAAAAPIDPEPSATSTANSGSAAPGMTPPPLSKGDEAVLAEFDLGDDFTSGIEPLPSSQSVGSPASSDDVFGNLPPIPVAAKPSAPAAEDVEYETEYRVKCNTCGSVLYAKAHQQGKQVKCSDCHSDVTVPPPPKKKKKLNLSNENAQTFQFEESKPKERVDPYRKSATELLEKAEQVEDEEEEPNYDTPDVRQWFMNVFGVFIDTGVLAHWIGLSFIASVPAMLAFSFESNVLVLGLFPGAILLAILVVACGFAILLSVANNQDSVEEWPTMDPMGWFEQMFIALAATSLAAVPAWVVGHLFFEPGLLAIGLTMFSVYALFPFFILSMLDMQSVMIPFSPEVARSATRCQESWGGFYFSSGLLFAALFLFFVALSTASPSTQAVLGIFATIFVAFAYFAMIGRLAYAIGQSVNDPPKKNDIDPDAHGTE